MLLGEIRVAYTFLRLLQIDVVENVLVFSLKVHHLGSWLGQNIGKRHQFFFSDDVQADCFFLWDIMLIKL